MWQNKNTSVYSTPFSAGYWKAAVSELHSLRSLTVAAVFLALSLAPWYDPYPAWRQSPHLSDFFCQNAGRRDLRSGPCTD